MADGEDKQDLERVDVDELIFGGKKGYARRHNVYMGFEDHDEVKTHVATLLNLEQLKP